MARKKRIWYPRATYHVMSRGNRRGAIFKDHADYIDFLECLRNVMNCKKCRKSMKMSYELAGDKDTPVMNGISIRCHTNKCT